MSDQNQPIIELVLDTDARGVTPTRYIVGETTFDKGRSDIEPKTVSHIDQVDSGHYIVYFDLGGERLKYREIYGIPTLVKYETRNLSQQK